ncbi:MAG: hypothetical protein IJX77_07305 [Ruminococcus sp.]|nr:hypothetical protein [Ruminococcus sp.]
MGTQFWWFFDTAAAAVILIFIYLSGKKGFSKTIVLIAGYALSITAAVMLAGKTADLIYEKTIMSRNTAKIEQALADISVSQKTKTLIDELGYNVTADETQIAEIFGAGGDTDTALYGYVNSIAGHQVDTAEEFGAKVIDGISDVFKAALGSALTDYESEQAADLIRKEGLGGFSETLAMMQAADRSAAAAHMEENYTRAASKDIVKVICFIIILFVLMEAVNMLSRKLSDSGFIRPMDDITDHALGGVLGAAQGVLVIFLAAAAVRILVVLGNNGMMLFNGETIDKTIFFRHIYNWTLKI